MEPQHGEIYIGDSLKVLGTIDSETIDCVVTSPPYWALRNYDKYEWYETGMGRHYEGDSWPPNMIGDERTVKDYIDILIQMGREVRRVLRPEGTFWLNVGDLYRDTGSSAVAYDGVPERSLVMLPHRTALAMVDGCGFTMRNDITWIKQNFMPHSVKNRFTNCHESIFLLTKHSRYYFDLDAVRIKSMTPPKPFNRRTRDALSGRLDGSNPRLGQMSDAEKGMIVSATAMSVDTALRPHASRVRNVQSQGTGMKNPADILVTSSDPPLKPFCVNCNEWLEPKLVVVNHEEQSRKCPACDVPVVEHVAPYPVELPAHCIRAGCPRGGIVLDPFMGSGTTAVAAEKLGRRWCGIEIAPRYAALARKRLSAYTGRTSLDRHCRHDQESSGPPSAASVPH